HTATTEISTLSLHDALPILYCEWPLGNGLQEAEKLAALAKKKGVLAVAGLQARSAPSVAYVRDLIRQGYVGEVLSTTLIGSGMRSEEHTSELQSRFDLVCRL